MDDSVKTQLEDIKKLLEPRDAHSPNQDEFQKMFKYISELKELMDRSGSTSTNNRAQVDKGSMIQGYAAVFSIVAAMIMGWVNFSNNITRIESRSTQLEKEVTELQENYKKIYEVYVHIKSKEVISSEEMVNAIKNMQVKINELNKQQVTK